MPKEDSAQTIDRAMQIIKSFSVNEKKLSLADLHRKLGLAKSTLQRILNTLVNHGVLDKDERQKTYQLGIELYFLGQIVEKNTSLMATAKPFMEQLRDEFGESISLNIIHQKLRKCIGYVQGNHELMTITYVGHTSPLNKGASAKVLLANVPQDELNLLLAELSGGPHSGMTISDIEELKKELEYIRENEYAISYGERVVGSVGISAPIKNRLSEVVAAISMAIPTVRFEEAKMGLYIEHVKKAASFISTKLKML